MATSRWEHDCPDCYYLGEYTHELSNGYIKECDLYVCPNEPTVVSRYGEDGEYSSGLVFVGIMDELTEAAKRAVERGLL